MRLMNLETFKGFCYEQGMDFIRNFELYYDDPITNEDSLKKLNSIYKSILETRVVDENNINIFNLMDWFISVDNRIEEYMKQPSKIKIKTYGDFVINLLYGEQLEVALRHAIEKNITYLDQ